MERAGILLPKSPLTFRGEMIMNKKILKLTAVFMAVAMLVCACGSAKNASSRDSGSDTVIPATEEVTTTAVSDGEESGSAEIPEEKVELTILAAASLTDVCDELKAQFENENPSITVSISYGGSGALQTQIEEGAPADVFMSAAMKQMTALDDEGLMDSDSIVQLLENKVVMIVPKESDTSVSSFEDAATDVVTMIGLGEPGSVPVGQYSEEIFEGLGILDAVKEKANYGSDVRTVLSWVETAAVDCGVVYATDAYTSEDVRIVCEAPEGSCSKVLYPVGVVAASEHSDEAAAWLSFIQREESMELFESYGFSDAR